MTKTTYAVQWFDTDSRKWSNDYQKYDSFEDASVALDLHKAEWPTLDTRLVKLETITTIQQITLSEPEAT